MQTHLEQVLTASGLPADQVKALVDLPADAKDFKTDTFTGAIHTTVREIVKNDPATWDGLKIEQLPKEVAQKLESEQYGRSAAIVRTNLLKAVGMTENDFKELGEDGKKIDVLLPAFVKRLTEGKITDKELQQKLMDANKTIEEMAGKEPELQKTIETRFQTKYNTDIAQFVVLAQLAQVTGLKAPPEYIADKITAKLQEQYTLVINGTTAVIRQKDKPDLKVLTNNGTEELKLADAVKAILKADNLLDEGDGKKKTTTKDGKVVVDVTPGDGDGLKLNKHVDAKIQKRLQQEAAAAGQ